MSSPMDAIDEILVNLYLGRNFTETIPTWKSQMDTPALAEAKQALLRLVAERERLARIDELKLVESLTYDCSCSFCGGEYLEERIKQLSTTADAPLKERGNNE
jgi:hypothetical protein